MLGSHDFCGYYDWTFSHVRERFGAAALQELWAEAIGRDSQSHYEDAGRTEALAGLIRTWHQAGIDEHCDWTFTLDEEGNVLRWDMRQCPSKGFLLDNDRNADEDYCDHCMGWIIPLLARIGIEITGHEHNHVGQCWAEMSVRAKPHNRLDLECDIRKDPRWKQGYLHRWLNNSRLPLLDDVCASSDPCDILRAWFAPVDCLLVVGRRAGTEELNPSRSPASIMDGPEDPKRAEPDRKNEERNVSQPRDPSTVAVVATDAAYSAREAFTDGALGVLLGNPPKHLAEVTERYLATPAEDRPMLMHTYLPGSGPVDFVSAGLPRPIPILPQLIRQGYYTHQPGQPRPTTDGFLTMLALSLHKVVYVLGIEMCELSGIAGYINDIRMARNIALSLPRRHHRNPSRLPVDPR